jgi:hypothetical protein
MADISVSPLVINLGDLPSWIIALVAAGGLWKAWKAERNSAKAATIAASSATAIEAIHKETNSMRSQLETAATARGVLVGRTQAHDEHAASLIQERSDAVSDAETAEKIKDIQSPPQDQK